MTLNLGLDAKDKQTLLSELSKTKEFTDTQDMMRAGVLLCAQEMVYETEQSSLEQYIKDVPDEDDVELAISLVNDFLQKRNLTKTSQVLMDELPDEVFEDGKAEAEKMTKNLPLKQGDLLSTIIANATD